MRPKIICHMVTSIDGKLHPSRFTGPAAGVDAGRLRKHYDEVSAKFGAQGWMCGRVTMQEISKGKPRTVTGPGISSREPFVGDRRDRDLAVSIDPHGKVHYGQDHLHGDHAVAVLSKTVSDTYLAELREDGVSYLFAGPDGRDFAKAMDALGETFGVETLLLEGGAAINGAFLKASLIDEISVLIHPAVNGLAGVESIFGYQGQAEERPGAGQALRHMSTETLEGGMCEGAAAPRPHRAWKPCRPGAWTFEPSRALWTRWRIGPAQTRCGERRALRRARRGAPRPMRRCDP